MREELEILMNRRWVLKAEEKELYYRLRDAAGEIRKFATEKMGCQIIANSLLIKMEKIPAVPEEWMGIREFTSREEYASQGFQWLGEVSNNAECDSSSSGWKYESGTSGSFWLERS